MTTTIILAIPRLFDAVVAQFAADLAATWTAPIFTGSGTSVVGVAGASSPTGTRVVAVKVTTGGTVGTTGIFYAYSLDGGATWSSPVALGTATSIAVPGAGVTLELGAGTLVVDDQVDVETTAASTPPPNKFGSREPAHRDGKSSRIVWVPGNDESGDVGKMGPARQPDRNPRPLMTIGELVTVYVEGYDATAPEDQRKQYEITRILADAFLRAVYLAAHGTFEVLAISWVRGEKGKGLRQHGAALRFLIAVDAMVPDAPLAIAVPEDLDVDVEFATAP